MQKALRGALPKLGQVLANEETAYQFMCALVQRCETLHVEITELGITVLKPTAGNLHSGSLSLEAKNAGEEIASGSNQVSVAAPSSPA